MSEMKLRGIKQRAKTFWTHQANLLRGIYLVPVDHGLTISLGTGSKEIPLEVDVQAYSENNDLLSEMLNEPPSWLTEKGGKKLQKEFLLIKVRMSVQLLYRLSVKEPLKIGVIFLSTKT